MLISLQLDRQSLRCAKSNNRTSRRPHDLSGNDHTSCGLDLLVPPISGGPHVLEQAEEPFFPAIGDAPRLSSRLRLLTIIVTGNVRCQPRNERPSITTVLHEGVVDLSSSEPKVLKGAGNALQRKGKDFLRYTKYWPMDASYTTYIESCPLSDGPGPQPGLFEVPKERTS